MGIDIVASAKDFEKHAQSQYLPEILARELHSLTDSDRLAVAKQIDWDMTHQSNPALPKIEFYDTGDLKSVEGRSKTGSTEFMDHTELDKVTGTIKSELKSTNTNDPHHQSSDIELVERNANGHMTYRSDFTTSVQGVFVKANSEEERWGYDATTGKQLTHDEKTSYGKILHEEFDATTGKEKSADETNQNATIHRTYDAGTGNLRQEDISNADKTQETIKYNSNGDKVVREKHYGNNGDQGTRTWNYNSRSGKPVYTEWHDPKGGITKQNIDEEGNYTSVKD